MHALADTQEERQRPTGHRATPPGGERWRTVAEVSRDGQRLIERLTPDGAIRAELGARLARLRKQRGITQEDLAQEAGLGVATLRRLEDGNDARLGSWLRLLKALDLAASIDALLPEEHRSPMAEVKTPRRSTGKPSTDFVWGDERR
ncbi:MAG: helix-turn-helix transcriptional regulator [Planctomycetota bacterium]|nr:helix-turn-helix transcriptional regulator [Planctomycetota bacterium]